MRCPGIAAGAVFLAVLSQSTWCAAEASAADQTSTDSVEICVGEHERARLLRVEERWLDARAAMQRCAAPNCPLAIRADCSSWLEELARTLPTLLVVVERDDDGKQPPVLELDGRRMELAEPARPIELAPGPHRVRVSLPPYPPFEREVVLKQGEKNHVVRVRFAREPEPVTPPAPTIVRVWSPPERPIPLHTYVLAGGALAAFSVSAALLVSALSARADAISNCSPTCDTDLRESIDLRLRLADVSGAAGLVLGGLAVYTFATRPAVEPAPGFTATPLPQGFGVYWKGAF